MTTTYKHLYQISIAFTFTNTTQTCIVHVAFMPLLEGKWHNEWVDHQVHPTFSHVQIQDELTCVMASQITSSYIDCLTSFIFRLISTETSDWKSTQLDCLHCRILSFVWKRYENTSPCDASRVNANFEWTASWACFRTQYFRISKTHSAPTMVARALTIRPEMYSINYMSSYSWTGTSPNIREQQTLQHLITSFCLFGVYFTMSFNDTPVSC